MQNFLQVRKFYFSDPQLAGGITVTKKIATPLDQLQLLSD